MRRASVPHENLRNDLLAMPQILLLIRSEAIPKLIDIVEAGAQHLQAFLVVEETRRRLQECVDTTRRQRIDLHHIEAVRIARKRRGPLQLFSPHPGDFFHLLIGGQWQWSGSSLLIGNQTLAQADGLISPVAEPLIE